MRKAVSEEFFMADASKENDAGEKYISLLRLPKEKKFAQLEIAVKEQKLIPLFSPMDGEAAELLGEYLIQLLEWFDPIKYARKDPESRDVSGLLAEVARLWCTAKGEGSKLLAELDKGYREVSASFIQSNVKIIKRCDENGLRKLLDEVFQWKGSKPKGR